MNIITIQKKIEKPDKFFLFEMFAVECMWGGKLLISNLWKPKVFQTEFKKGNFNRDILIEIIGYSK